MCIYFYQYHTRRNVMIVYCLITSFDLEYMPSSGQLFMNINVNRNYHEVVYIRLIILKIQKYVYYAKRYRQFQKA